MIQLISTSLLIWFIYAVTRVTYSHIEQKFTKKSPLWFIKWYGDQYLHENIYKLLYECPKCMAWVWTSVSSIYFGFYWHTIGIAMLVSGLNYIIGRLMPYTDE